MIRALFLVGLALACSTPQAQSISAVRLQVDNDYFAMRFGRAPMDFDYTSGLELGVQLDYAPTWASALLPFSADLTTMELAVGQRIYTPRSRGERDLPGQRPFAGWLYGGASVHAESARAIQDFRLEVGVVGPPALAEETQNGLHSLYGSEQLMGWEDQLPTEPAISLSYDLAGRVRLVVQPGIELRPGAGIGLGTIWTGARLGSEVVATFGAFSVFAGLQGEWVVRDEFLDGTAFRESQSAEKIPLVGQHDFGARLRLGRFEAAAQFVTRSREYEGQLSSHQYGSLSTSLYF